MTTTAPDQPTFTIDQAARELKRSKWTLRDQVTRGEVPHHRSGRVKGVYFTPEDLEAIRATEARGVRTAPAAHADSGTAREAPVPVSIPDEFARLRKGA